MLPGCSPSVPPSPADAVPHRGLTAPGFRASTVPHRRHTGHRPPPAQSQGAAPQGRRPQAANSGKTGQGQRPVENLSSLSPSAATSGFSHISKSATMPQPQSASMEESYGEGCSDVSAEFER